MTKFLIIVPTYNRNEMVNETLKSIFDQTYPDWQVLVSDNASPQPVANTIPAAYQQDPRFTLVRREALTLEHGELLLQQAPNYDFDYWMSLADDDLLLPFALEQVARYGGRHAVMQSSFYGYNEADKTVGFSDMLNDPSQETIEYDSKQFLNWFVQTNGIKLKNDTGQHYRRPPLGPTHPSATWSTRDLLQRTLRQYGRITTPPFGDIGYFKFGLNGGAGLYINRPLVMVRFHRGSYGNASGHAGLAPRVRLAQQHNMAFKFSRLKAVTFCNGARESCLALLNDLSWEYTSHLGAGFLLRHSLEILRDRPWTNVTLKDLGEVLPFLILQGPEIVSFVLGYFVRHEKLNYDTVTTPGQASIWDAMALCSENGGTTYLEHCRHTIRQRKNKK